MYAHSRPHRFINPRVQLRSLLIVSSTTTTTTLYTSRGESTQALVFSSSFGDSLSDFEAKRGASAPQSTFRLNDLVTVALGEFVGRWNSFSESTHLAFCDMCIR